MPDQPYRSVYEVYIGSHRQRETVTGSSVRQTNLESWLWSRNQPPALQRSKGVQESLLACSLSKRRTKRWVGRHASKPFVIKKNVVILYSNIKVKKSFVLNRFIFIIIHKIQREE